MIYCHVVEPSLGLAPTIVDRIFEMILRLRETGLMILLKEAFVILGMLVIGGLSTVSGAVVGAFLVTFAFEGLRALESPGSTWPRCFRVRSSGLPRWRWPAE